MPNLLAVLAAALLLLWPAFLNGYPLVFSDTGGFLEQALMPDMGWDKPWIYGPFLTPFHARLTLWPAAFAQALLLSTALWLTQATFAPPRKSHHLALCAFLALTTAAPWFAALLMPDILAPITVLGLFILASATPRLGAATRTGVALVTTIAIAAHLAHLILAAACIATLALLQWRTLRRTTLPLAAALILLVASNLIGHGRFAVSPYGATFALARLVADRPARDVIDQACPGAGWRLCAWKGRLPTNSDDFLWDPNGPVWADGYGPVRIAPEAAAIVRATLMAEPAQVLQSAIRNTAAQLALVAVGDALVPDYLDVTVLPRLQAYFPPAEAARFSASQQASGALPGLAAPFTFLHGAVLLAGTLATVGIAFLQWRDNRSLATLAILTLVALLANAFATGALSGPHDRYQARIAWLVLLPPALYLSSKRPVSANPPAHP